MHRRLACPTLLVIAAVVSGCTTTVTGMPSVAPAPVQTASPSAAADRHVCIDLDARGGELYNVLVVPMMAGPAGPKSIDVDVARFTRATAAVAQVGRSALREAGQEIADEGERMVAAAESLGMYDHADSTALLTSFVGLSVACQKAGHKPSWFDAGALTSN